MILTFDIETLPTNNAELIAEFELTITAPGQYKKPESIAEWLIENKESALKEIVAKTSFDGLYGRIACISWQFDDGEICSTYAGMTEKEAITDFYAFINSKPENILNNLVFCGHNISGFDLPFLKHRSIILGVKPPKALLDAMNAKPWDRFIQDTMLMWNQSRDKYASMEKLCRAFGIESKGDFDGSMVADTWPVDPEKVLQYCRDDVNRTRQIYKRLTFNAM